ncbi:hypothetical protein B0H19DRAFT_1297686 [Mycena capillaripes]|nr:hypothetical protein B0H19DRAFT_1297686 [Mycena capillaripes]
MGLFDSAFGLSTKTSLIGTWAALFLCGLAFSQAIQYYNDFPNDSSTRRILGSPPAFTTETWSVPAYTIFNSLTAALVNSYLISRFYTVSKNIVLTIMLCLLALFPLVMAPVSVLIFPGIENVRTHPRVWNSHDNPTYQFQKAEKLALIWAIASVTYVTIAASLIWTLRGMKTNFSDTNRLIRRVMIISLQNGCTTSLTAVAGLIAVIVKINSNIPACFFFLLSLYVLTLLSNFNLRGSGKSGSRTWSSSRNNKTANTSIVIDGIHVWPTNVKVDPTGLELEIEMASKKLGFMDVFVATPHLKFAILAVETASAIFNDMKLQRHASY